VKKEITEGDTSKPPVKDPSPFHSSPEQNKSFCPEGIRIFYRKASQGEPYERHHHHQVDESVEDMKAPVYVRTGKLIFFYHHRLNPFSSTIHELS
jgi:hypothetical protein